ncbi:MAG TPA: DUF6541 family protein [Myxococcales bacterium]
MIAVVLGIFLLGLGALPGILAADALAPALPPVERRVLGLITGLALTTIACYLAALSGVLVLAIALLGVTTAAFAWLYLRPGDAPGAQPLAPRATGGSAHAAHLWGLAAVALAFAAFATPLLLRPVPQGWDPAFHSAIIDSIRRLGELPTTWGPYEPAEKFNYPAAMHAVFALYAKLSGVAPDSAFTLGFLWIGALMLLAVYALGLRFGGGSARAGTLAVLVYGLSDGWGTLAGHAGWGGLPNLAGLVLMAGFVLAVSEPSRGGIVLAALLAAAIAFTHHLSFALLGFSVGVLVLLELVVERRWSAAGKAGFWAIALAVATAGLLVMLRPSGRFDLLHAFKFEREKMTDLFKAWEVMGPVLLAGGLAGLVASLFSHRAPGQRLLPAWTVGLLAFWVLWDMVYRAAVWWIAHGSWTALTPSRGLTDAAVPLAVCLALLVDRLASRLPSRWPWAVVGAAALALAALGYPGERDRVRGAPASRGEFAGARELCEAVKKQTPPDAILFAPNAGEVGIWLPYLCNRELNYFPDPGYYQSPYRETKMRLQDPKEFARFVAPQGRQTFYATRGQASFPRVASVGGWNLYRIGP